MQKGKPGHAKHKIMQNPGYANIEGWLPGLFPIPRKGIENPRYDMMYALPFLCEANTCMQGAIQLTDIGRVVNTSRPVRSHIHLRGRSQF